MILDPYSPTGMPPMTGTATLTVYVGDVNDNAPDIGVIEPSDVIVGTETKIGDEVFRFQAADDDAGDDPIAISYICNNPKCQDFNFRQSNSKFHFCSTNAKNMNVCVCVCVCVVHMYN